MLHRPPINHSNVGYFQSKTFVHGSCQCNSFAISAQNASGSSAARLHSASKSFRRVSCFAFFGGWSSLSPCKSWLMASLVGLACNGMVPRYFARFGIEEGSKGCGHHPPEIYCMSMILG